MNEIAVAILKTLVYFDIFEYPLSVIEIWKWLYADKTDGSQIFNKSLVDIEEVLGQLSDKVEQQKGFYFLVGRQALVDKRLARYSVAEPKFKRALKFIKVFRLIPFVKMIAVCNSLAYSNSGRTSDIDLFIIAERNRLWLTRLLVVGWLKFWGVRPEAGYKQDTIDSTFFLSESALNISQLKIKPEDIYLTYWLDQLVPIYDPQKIYFEFQKANAWVKNYLPNCFGYQTSHHRQVADNWFSKVINLILIWLIDWNWLEQAAKTYQLKVMPQDLKNMMNRDSRVVVNDRILKFHKTDRRQEYQEKFLQKLSRLI